MHRHAPAHEPPKERYQTQRGLACDTAAKARARSTQCAHCGRGRAYQAAAACPVLHSSPRACMVRLQPEQAWCQQAKLKLSFGLEGEELGCALGTPVRYTLRGEKFSISFLGLHCAPQHSRSLCTVWPIPRCVVHLHAAWHTAGRAPRAARPRSAQLCKWPCRCRQDAARCCWPQPPRSPCGKVCTRSHIHKQLT